MLDTQHIFLETENPVHVRSASDRRFVPGEGESGFASFVKALYEIGYKDHLSVKHWGPNIDQITLKSKEYLDNLIVRKFRSVGLYSNSVIRAPESRRHVTFRYSFSINRVFIPLYVQLVPM